MLTDKEKIIDAGFKRFEPTYLTSETILEDDIFEHLFSLPNFFERQKMVARLTQRAKELRCLKAFNMLLSCWQSNFAQKEKTKDSNTMQFTNAPLDGLNCGKWTCTDSGVHKVVVNSKDGSSATFKACSHPILPLERYKNIDTKSEKIKIAYFQDKDWQSATFDRKLLSNKNNIVNISDLGIDVTTESSKDLVSYLSDVLAKNEIPVYKSVSRCGWLSDGFSPYFGDLKFDGDVSFRDMYESLASRGDYEEWKKELSKMRKQSKIFRVLLSASFASPLIHKVGALPYILHLYGGTGAGKTVGLMVAMSVWGNPALGKLVKSLNNTNVSFSRTAGFLNNIPMACDELEMLSKHVDTDKLIMLLCEGMDKGRGTIDGGLQVTHSWKNAFLFSGEHPITRESSGGGVKNRVIEIYCGDTVVHEGNRIVNFITENYGFAGKEYINNLPNDGYLRDKYNEFFNQILKNCDTTEKQAMAMSMNLLGSELSNDIIFQDGYGLTVDDVAEYLTSSKDVDVSRRAYDWTINWISQNYSKFVDNYNEVWGKIDGLYCYINKNVLVEHLNKNNFDYSAVSRKWAERGLIERNTQGKYFHNTHIHGIKSMYVKLLVYNEKEVENTLETLPF